MKNRSHHQTLRVSLGARSYPIYIGEGQSAFLGEYFVRHRLPRTVVIITDANVAPLYLRKARQSLTKQGFAVHAIVVPAGEKQKSMRRADAIYGELLRLRIERNSTIVALGGGVVGDLAGFIAATFQRGVHFVQVPTTLLAQVDSSVGGKVGINHDLGKNMIGAFYQPAFVVADIETLSTLPSREIVCGLGEVMKYGVIMDKKFFSFVERNIRGAMRCEPRVLAQIVAGCCRMKAYVVERDEKEQNVRAILNFGHTVGHALEHAGGYNTLKHGEAILLGMVAETFAAHRLGALSLRDAARIEAAVLAVPFPPSVRRSFSKKRILFAMRLDKKVAGGKIRFILPLSVGVVSLPVPIDERIILDSLAYLEGFVRALQPEP